MHGVQLKHPGVKSGIAKAAGAKADILYEPNDAITVGKSIELKVLATPGHTSGCVSYHLAPSAGQPGAVFTGDALLIRGCGRTDFQQGSSETLYASVHNRVRFQTSPVDTYSTQSKLLCRQIARQLLTLAFCALLPHAQHLAGSCCVHKCRSGCCISDYGGNSFIFNLNVTSARALQLFTLPDDTVVYPAHDYRGFTSSTIGEEKQHNPRLSKSKAEFADIMAKLNLPYPKKIDVALPANLVCGVQEQ